MSNQFSGPFADHDSSIRPGAIFVFLALPAMLVPPLVLGVVGVLPVNGRETAVLRPPESTLLGLLVLVIAVGTICWVAYGWHIGFVPFVPMSPTTPLVDHSVLPEGQPIRCGLTGILEISGTGIRRRYRNRPSVLVFKDGKINFLVNRWKTEYIGRQRSYAAVASLEPADVANPARGAAYLVSHEMPAIRVSTPQGPLVLIFGTPEFRDSVYSAIATFVVAGPSSMTD
jgi:hypothetical protein